MPASRSVRSASIAAALAAGALLVAAYAGNPAVAERGRLAAADLQAAAPADVGLSADRLDQLAARIQAMVDDGKLAGAVTLLARHGRIAFADVAGMQDIATGRPLARDTIFRIYSMTKPITGVALMMLHEEGKWRLDDPVSRYIPGFADLDVHVMVDKLDRIARIYRESDAGKLEETDMGRPTRKSMPAGPSGGGGLWGTADDYLRFTQMLLNEGELDGARLLAPETVELMRSNHLSPQALATMRPGQGFGLDFAVVLDPAQAREPYATGSYYWGGAAGTWFWIDPLTDLTFVGMIQHLGPAGREVQALSRRLAYQAVVRG